MGLKLIIFDAEGTFLRIDPPVGYYYARLFAKVGVKLDPRILQEKIKKLYPLVFKNREKDRWNEELCRRRWRTFFTILFWRFRREDWFNPLFREAYTHFATKDCVVPIPGFPEFAHYLKERGLKLCVLSNWDGRLHSVLGGLNLDKFFDRIYTGCEIGYLKPHPESFLRPLRDFQVRPEEAMMIGDNLEDDVKPALALRMRAIHFQEEDYFGIFSQAENFLI